MVTGPRTVFKDFYFYWLAIRCNFSIIHCSSNAALLMLPKDFTPSYTNLLNKLTPNLVWLFVCLGHSLLQCFTSTTACIHVGVKQRSVWFHSACCWPNGCWNLWSSLRLFCITLLEAYPTCVYKSMQIQDRSCQPEDKGALEHMRLKLYTL